MFLRAERPIALEIACNWTSPPIHRRISPLKLTCTTTHETLSIYAALAVPEVWRFDGEALTIHLLEQGSYRESATSLALTILTSRLLTDVLAQLRTEGEFVALMAFDKWLQGLPL